MSGRGFPARLSLVLCGVSLVVGTSLSGCGQGTDPARPVTPGAEFTDVGSPPPQPDRSTADPAVPPDDAEQTRVTRPVPPPVDSDLRDKVPVEEQVVLPGVKVTERVAVDGVTVSVTSVERLQTEARGPGEIGGPAAAVTISMRNRTNDSLDLSSTTVAASDDGGAPLIPLSGAPATPFEGELDPLGHAQAVYVFSLAGAKAPLAFTVNLAADTPVAVFTGALSE